MNMITLEGRPAATATTVRARWTGADAQPADETLSALDTGLMATFSTRLHCRRPMEIVDPNELSPRQPLHVGGLSEARLAPTEAPITYRCQCGFTMDEASAVRDYAVAS
jgi:hypothetical protein